MSRQRTDTSLRPGFRGTPAATIGLLVAFGWIFLFLVPGISGHNLANTRDDVINIAVKWSVLLILCVIAFALRQWTPSELGLHPMRWGDLLAAVGAFVIALALSGVASRLVAMPPQFDMHKLAAVPLAVRFGVVLTAAVSEEFLYRGYGIEEIFYLTGNYSIAGLLSLLIFTVSHAGLYGFSRSLIVPGLVGAVLTGLYLWRRNLLACMLVHFLIDGLFLLLVPSLVGAH